MMSIANQKRFIGLTVTCLATIVPLSMLSNRIALGQTVDEQTALLKAALSEHNVKRAIHGSPALTAAAATDPLTTGAQQWALKLASDPKPGLVHSTGAYGENLSVNYTTEDLSATTIGKGATDDWYAEINNYDFTKPKFGESTGHFTQVVWKNTTKLGCGYAVGTATLPAEVTTTSTASDGTKTTTTSTVPTLFNAYYTVCRYTTAGNVQGTDPNSNPSGQTYFSTNVFPSMAGKSGS